MPRAFEPLKLTRQFLNALDDLEFETPTPIQLEAIPAIRSGQPVIGIAQTGTGKTAAYLLPVLQKLKYAQGDLPRLLVLVPTKELVLQVVGQFEQLSKYTDLRVVGLLGGVAKVRQLDAVDAGCDAIIATPRRLLEVYEEGLTLKKIDTFIVDEADKMLDMGFLPQLNLILDVLPRKKQNLLFSATFSPQVEELSWNFMEFPTKIEITPEATPVETVTHWRYDVPNLKTKMNLLEYLLQDESFSRVIVFTKTRKTATVIANRLARRTTGEIRVIHSNKGQNTRINAMDAFKAGEIRILVTTDVTARGIDVEGVSHVINFEVPLIYEDYVHRIGRTGRAQHEGTAITFVNKAEQYHIEQIERKIRTEIPHHKLPEEVLVEPTPFEENQLMDREIDDRKKKLDPTYKGAFHEKQRRPSSGKKKKGGKRFNPRGSSFFAKGGSKKRKTSKRKRK